MIKVKIVKNCVSLTVLTASFSTQARCCQAWVLSWACTMTIDIVTEWRIAASTMGLEFPATLSSKNVQEPQQRLSAGCLSWPSEGATKGSQGGEGSSRVSLMWSAAKLSSELSARWPRRR